MHVYMCVCCACACVCVHVCVCVCMCVCVWWGGGGGGGGGGGLLNNSKHRDFCQKVVNMCLIMFQLLNLNGDHRCTHCMSLNFNPHFLSQYSHTHITAHKMIPARRVTPLR